MNLQKKIASRVLKVGVSRIWLDPTKKKEIESAITAADVRKLVKKGYIKVLPEKTRKRKVRKRRKGPGSRKGSRGDEKEKWMKTIRALRSLLRELKKSGKIDNATYRKLYLLAKGGMFRSRSHLLLYAKQHGMVKE